MLRDASDLPPQWDAMEIETKWEIRSDQWKMIIKHLLDDGDDKKFGYDFKARWKGVGERMNDEYFDTADGKLTAAGHVLRL